MTSEFSFTNSLNFSSLQNFDSNALFNFTAFNILQKKMLERQSKPPDFIPLEYAWPRNESVHAPNCTAGAEYSLKTTNARMGQTELYMEAMKQSSEDMFVSLSSIDCHRWSLICHRLFYDYLSFTCIFYVFHRFF